MYVSPVYSGRTPFVLRLSIPLSIAMVVPVRNGGNDHKKGGSRGEDKVMRGPYADIVVTIEGIY